ncbi:MAG: hypothetical protein K0A99_05075 [Desulfoarculaceae bacterium]|nr:hypothetical protein [Desulfoarculaceae bacterium]
MNLKFKKQLFQTEAVNAVADCFADQPRSESVSYRIDPGVRTAKATPVPRKLYPGPAADLTQSGFKNRELVLTGQQLLENIHAVSRRYRNRRIGEFLKELELTEGRSTGVPKILKAMAANGSSAPVFETDDDRLAYMIRLPVHPLAESPVSEVTPEVTPEMLRMLEVMRGDMNRVEIMAALGLKDEKHFREHYQQAGIASGVIEMTQPDKPRSSKQRYRLTATGRSYLQVKDKGGRE